MGGRHKAGFVLRCEAEPTPARGSQVNVCCSVEKKEMQKEREVGVKAKLGLELHCIA